jgi:hypothetical protein
MLLFISSEVVPQGLYRLLGVHLVVECRLEDKLLCLCGP